jgi:hypothetical protein
MAYTLKSVVPWGRSFDEYLNMFMLSPNDLKKNIIGFGDGPAAFNAEMKLLGNKTISVDPIYQFGKLQIMQRIADTSSEVITQVRANQEYFVWNIIKSPEELLTKRLNAMELFLEDFEKGSIEGRYLPHSLPDKTSFPDLQFDIGLSSHFLLLYSSLGHQFHMASLKEMMRICKEVRIFPIIDLNNKTPDFFNELIKELNAHFNTCIEPVNYEFQRGGNNMLKISHR